MNNDLTENKAAAALAFINAEIAAGRTIYVSTMTRCFAINAKVVAKFAKVGIELFKLNETGLRMANGKAYNRIATPSMLLVGLTSQ
jgi:hypothetical protein